MPSGVYPDVLARAVKIGGVKHRKGDPHPAKGLSKNKFNSDGTPRKARKTRSKLVKVKEELGFQSKYTASEEYIYRRNMLNQLKDNYDFGALGDSVINNQTLDNFLEEIEDKPDLIFSKEVSDFLKTFEEKDPEEYENIRSMEVDTMSAEELGLRKQVGTGHPNVGYSGYYDIDRTAEPQKETGGAYGFGRRKHLKKRTGAFRAVGDKGEEIDYEEHPHFVSEAIMAENLRNTKDDDYEDYSKDYYRGNVVEDLELPLGPTSMKDKYSRLGLFSELLTTKGKVRERAKRSDFGRKIGRYKDVKESQFQYGGKYATQAELESKPDIVVERAVGRSYKGAKEDKLAFDTKGSVDIVDNLVMPETATDMDGNPIEIGGPYQQFLKDDASAFLSQINETYQKPEGLTQYDVEFDPKYKKDIENLELNPAPKGVLKMRAKQTPFQEELSEEGIMGGVKGLRTSKTDYNIGSHMGIDPHAMRRGELTLDMIQNPDKYVLEGKDLKYDTFGSKGLSKKRAEKYGIKLKPRFGEYNKDAPVISNFMDVMGGGGAIAEKIAKTINVKPPQEKKAEPLGGGGSAVPPLIEGSDLDTAVKAKKGEKLKWQTKEGQHITFQKNESGKFLHPNYRVVKGEDGKFYAKKKKKPKFIVKKSLKDSP